MIKLYLTTLFFVIFCSNELFSQSSVKGQIVDYNNISIASAEVLLLKQNKIIKGEVSNINVFF